MDTVHTAVGSAITAFRRFDRAMASAEKLTAAGKPVFPVIRNFERGIALLDNAIPGLRAANFSEWMQGEVSRVRGGLTALSQSLVSLRENEGMRRFDTAFAHDDPQWDAWFRGASEVAQRAIGVLQAH